MNVGFRIKNRSRAVSAEMVEKFSKIPVANISDSMNRITAGGPTLRAVHQGSKMAGPAFTVKTRPGDNLMIHKALGMAAPGDVVVVDGGGDLTNALIGELMVAYAIKQNLGGIVINGAIRDLGSLSAGTFPVFAAGVTHRGPYKDGPGEINVPIAIGGMVIEPGDLIIGDEDGLLCVPFDAAEEVYVSAKKKNDAEASQMKAITDGTSDRSWIDVALRARGCEFP